ncbi:hypothetical protein GSI_12261 [Ganoderma sinense ZZ0214-1]|uniref:Uncharacterized protein n=1 Tax=Ganoderma sinense ZZ0214-1 TaxID=1077348 RepID=A0A2G8RYA6_9APHY|nr:hypothetical protein GSI_12261 [Ganoderma sinense ZZ0214-1]
MTLDSRSTKRPRVSVNAKPAVIVAPIGESPKLAIADGQEKLTRRHTVTDWLDDGSLAGIRLAGDAAFRVYKGLLRTVFADMLAAGSPDATPRSTPSTSTSRA